ncbi:MAG: VCBS repeat-containing protein [Cyclobacteriaceae bacterium]
MKILYLALIACLILGCTKEKALEQPERKYVEPASPLFFKTNSKETGISFINEVIDGEKFNVLTYRNFYNGGGVAIGDINNDGLADIYFTANMNKNRLFLNKGNWKFEDITEEAGVGGKQGWSTGTTMADVNGDGFLDIYVCNSGDIDGDNKENELFINQGNLTFKEAAAIYGLNDKGFSTHASFFDYDSDGDLDCYVLNNSFKEIGKFDISLKAREQRDVLGGDKLYRNDNGKFVDVSERANIYGGKIGFGLGVSVGDVNGDMHPDIYVSNDFFERDYLYINQKDGTFKEQLPQLIGHTSISSMGADIADINNDGWADIFSTDMRPDDDYRLKTMSKFDEYSIEDLKFRSSFHYQYLQNGLQINSGVGKFSEIGFLAGVATTDWSWGALIFDFENDGWKDILVSNGINRDIMFMDFTDFLADRSNIEKVVKDKGRYDFRDFLPYLPSTRIANYAFVNKRDLTFENQAYKLGLGEPSFSNGAAYGDLDNDGDLDIVVNNENMECFVYRNESDKFSKNHFLKIYLKGAGKNTFGVGAEVRIYANGSFQSLQQMPSRGFESSVEPVLNFGLGKDEQVDSLVVIWPNRKMEIQKKVKSDLAITLTQTNATINLVMPKAKVKYLLTDVTEENPSVLHTENTYNDFNYERLLPHMLSTQGPKLAKGDVNGDGLEDIFICGARNASGVIILQDKSGHFIKTNQPDLVEDSAFEDTAAEFFDVDGDKDLDLLVGSGGGEDQEGSIPLTARLYVNDGNGNFKAMPERTPPVSVNASCIRAFDFDNDGDSDVFIGGRNVTNNYGLNPRSYLLMNEPAGFRDVTPVDLQRIGMVTDAVWTDYDRDGKKDLMIVGEWMPVTLFKNTGSSIVFDSVIRDSNGWWNAIEEADLDNDGKPEYVLGNWGLNSRFKASIDKPIQLFVKDFDQNGKTEPILTYFSSDGKSYPMASKNDITSQVPSLKKKFLKYDDYASKSYQQVFNEEQRIGATEKNVYTLSTSILTRKETGWSLLALPLSAQVAPVFGIAVYDFDHDKINDIFLVGNFFSLKPEVGRLDANNGIVLKGKGNLMYESISPSKTGITVTGESRDMKVIYNILRKPMFVLAKNNDKIQWLKANE